MVASCMLSGSCLFILGLSLLSCVTHASPISAETEKISKKMDMGTNGFYGDTFDNGFGVFETTKRRIVPSGHLEEPFAQRLRRIPVHKRMPYIVHKRMGMGENGFHGDTFSSGFGDFSTAKRKRFSNTNGFYGDTFSDGFGDFSTAKKRSMGMNSFHGDTFSQGFGDFGTV